MNGVNAKIHSVVTWLKNESDFNGAASGATGWVAMRRSNNSASGTGRCMVVPNTSNAISENNGGRRRVED